MDIPWSGTSISRSPYFHDISEHSSTWSPLHHADAAATAAVLETASAVTAAARETRKFEYNTQAVLLTCTAAKYFLACCFFVLLSHKSSCLFPDPQEKSVEEETSPRRETKV